MIGIYEPASIRTKTCVSVWFNIVDILNNTENLILCLLKQEDEKRQHF